MRCRANSGQRFVAILTASFRRSATLVLFPRLFHADLATLICAFGEAITHTVSPVNSFEAVSDCGAWVADTLDVRRPAKGWPGAKGWLSVGAAPIQNGGSSFQKSCCAGSGRW